MPVFEYKCEKCGRICSFLEKTNPSLIERIIGKRCPSCKSRKLKKQYSSFSTSKNMSQDDLLNDISKIAPITQAQDSSGECPYKNSCNQKK